MLSTGAHWRCSHFAKTLFRRYLICALPWGINSAILFLPFLRNGYEDKLFPLRVNHTSEEPHGCDYHQSVSLHLEWSNGKDKSNATWFSDPGACIIDQIVVPNRVTFEYSFFSFIRTKNLLCLYSCSTIWVTFLEGARYVINGFIHVSYFIAYKTVSLSQNNLNNLDPSYKTDRDFWDCFRRETPIL